MEMVIRMTRALFTLGSTPARSFYPLTNKSNNIFNYFKK